MSIRFVKFIIFTNSYLYFYTIVQRTTPFSELFCIIFLIFCIYNFLPKPIVFDWQTLFSGYIYLKYLKFSFIFKKITKKINISNSFLIFQMRFVPIRQNDKFLPVLTKHSGKTTQRKNFVYMKYFLDIMYILWYSNQANQYRGVEQGKLVGLITRRSLVQIQPPQPETEPDLIQSQIRFFFLYRKKSWNYARKWG